MKLSNLFLDDVDVLLPCKGLHCNRILITNQLRLSPAAMSFRLFISAWEVLRPDDVVTIQARLMEILKLSDLVTESDGSY